MAFPALERRNTEARLGAALELTSNSSNSSVVGPPDTRKPESREKVSAWLRGDYESQQRQNPLDELVRLPQDDREADLDVRKSLDNKLTYELDVAPTKHKVQCLLSFGEYSLFKKWKVLAEGDFIPFKPGPDSACQKYYEDKLSKKRRKVSLRDVRTLAITKNWLVMARLYRLYQVERDSVVPGGISLELRRLVPLRYLRVCVARPAARVIGVANQSGVLKQYQMLDKPDPTDGDPFMTWRHAIGRLRPNLNDDVLYLTLNTFERWKRQHACRLTIYPGYQSQSGISLNDWQVKLGEKEPEQCRCDKTPAPPPKKQPPKSASSSSIEYVSGRQVSIGDSVEGFLTDEDSQKFEGIVKTIGGSEEMSEIMEAPLSPTPLTPVASSSNNGAGSFSGAALLNVDAPPPSAGRRRKSLKTIFRLGFLTTKKRTKSKSEEGMPSPDAGPTQPPAGRRIVQRRMSRLEMNEPIEDIFSEVKFDIIQKRPSTNSAGNELSSGDVSDDDDDIIEDPEVILRSIMNKKVCESDDDNIFFDDVTKPATNNNGDVTNPGLMEKDLLLPETERNLPLAPVTEEVTIKITNENSDDDDLR